MRGLNQMQANNVAKTIGALLLAAAPLSQADDGTATAPPSNEIRLGVYYVHYFPSSSDLSGPFVPSGLNFSFPDIETPYFGYIRRLNSRFDVELAFGWPPVGKTEGQGPALLGSVPYNGQVLSTARWLAPTALLEYNLVDDSHKLVPFVGVGVNYTKFYDRDSTAAGNAASGGPTSISLPASVGPAATVGLNYRLSEHWAVHGSYSVSKVYSRLTADTGGLLRTADIDFWPTALVVSGGYSF
jgi:outer membrane protein